MIRPECFARASGLFFLHARNKPVGIKAMMKSIICLIALLSMLFSPLCLIAEPSVDGIVMEASASADILAACSDYSFAIDTLELIEFGCSAALVKECYGIAPSLVQSDVFAETEYLPEMAVD